MSARSERHLWFQAPGIVGEHVAAVHSIVRLGQLFRDNSLITEKLRSLHLDAEGLHGNLHVIRSALERMQANIRELINEVETGGQHRDSD